VRGKNADVKTPVAGLGCLKSACHRPSIVMARLFRAPRRVVSRPGPNRTMSHAGGSRGVPLAVCEIDLRPGAHFGGSIAPRMVARACIHRTYRK